MQVNPGQSNKMSWLTGHQSGQIKCLDWLDTKVDIILYSIPQAFLTKSSPQLTYAVKELCVKVLYDTLLDNNSNCMDTDNLCVFSWHEPWQPPLLSYSMTLTLIFQGLYFRFRPTIIFISPEQNKCSLSFETFYTSLLPLNTCLREI